MPARRKNQCRWGGPGCSRNSTRGRFGRWWCDSHGEFLERQAEEMTTAAKAKGPKYRPGHNEDEEALEEVA